MPPTFSLLWASGCAPPGDAEGAPRRRFFSSATSSGWSTLVDGALPGLTREIEAARQAALGARPPLAALRPAERAAEELVRSLLRAPVADTATQIAHIVGGAVPRTRLAEFAERFTAGSTTGAKATVCGDVCCESEGATSLLLLSDGKPNDEDSYDGEYGVEDVRHAVAEAGALGVRPFCITIDRAGPSYLPRIFGPSGYTVLWDVEQLPLRLPRLYRQLTAGAG